MSDRFNIEHEINKELLKMISIVQEFADGDVSDVAYYCEEFKKSLGETSKLWDTFSSKQVTSEALS